MNFQVIIIVLFIVNACFASRAGRRRRRRQRRVEQKILAQENNVARILATKELSLFENDYLDGSRKYKSTICDYMDQQLFADKFERFTTYTFSDENRAAFVNEYLSKIYNKENFPLTYRSSNVNLDATNEQIVDYYSIYCSSPSYTSYKFMMVFMMVFIALYIACFVVSYFVSACLKSGFHNKINMFW
uniref:Uncharacterized protein n=1 Tax=viral metagenome TaxID=1070528 RepID=A0A6C0B9H7_9ZZZZ